MFGALYGLFEWAFLGIVPVLLYLLIGEVIWARVARPRFASIALGAVIVGTYPFALQAGQVQLSAQAFGWLLSFAAIGAAFGAIARLPGPRATK
jgi:hypothetical protein